MGPLKNATEMLSLEIGLHGSSCFEKARICLVRAISFVSKRTFNPKESLKIAHGFDRSVFFTLLFYSTSSCYDYLDKLGDLQRILMTKRCTSSIFVRCRNMVIDVIFGRFDKKFKI